jgi:hypothetical protein
MLGRRLGSKYARAPLDYIQIELKNAPFRKEELGHRDDRKLDPFPDEGAAGGQEQVLHQLLRDCRRAAALSPVKIILNRDLNLFPVESMMLEKSRVLSGYDCVLKERGNLLHRDEDAGLVVRPSMYQRFQAALYLYGGGGRIQPAHRQKAQYHQRIDRDRREDEDPCDSTGDGTSAYLTSAPMRAVQQAILQNRRINASGCKPQLPAPIPKFRRRGSGELASAAFPSSCDVELQPVRPQK